MYKIEYGPICSLIAKYYYLKCTICDILMCIITSLTEIWGIYLSRIIVYMRSSHLEVVLMPLLKYLNNVKKGGDLESYMVN